VEKPVKPALKKQKPACQVYAKNLRFFRTLHIFEQTLGQILRLICQATEFIICKITNAGDYNYLFVYSATPGV
jgi:hypothetical protein